MSKGKGKRQARKPVSRERIAQAKYAKAHGLLSKSAKLDNGKLSRGVAKKIAALEELRAVPTYEYRQGAKRAHVLDSATRVPFKVNKSLAQKLKAQQFEVFGNFALIPNEGRTAKSNRYIRQLEKGEPAGIRRMTHQASIGGEKPNRVAADTVEVIALDTMGISNYADLHRALTSGLIDEMAKHDDEIFSFTFFGYHPRDLSGGGYAGQFFDGKELAEYLERYKWTEEAFDNFELVRMEMGQSLGPTPDWVYEANRKRSKRTVQDRRKEATLLRARRNVEARKTVSEDHKKEKTRTRVANWRGKQYSDPTAHKALKERDAKRKADSRAAKKKES
jgi:hypothetical protein